jgi:chemotaxis-related protein WspB
VAITQIPQAPPAVAGVLNYRGAPVPVIDLSQLTLGRPAERRLSTRIVLVHYPDARGGTQLLGLIAERATHTVRREETDFVASGVTSEGASYLGAVAPDARGLLQWLDARTLLPASVRDMLFRQAKAE